MDDPESLPAAPERSYRPARADSVLKYAAALALVFAGSGIGYYYGMFLPDQARAAKAASEEAEHRRQAELAKAAQARSRSEAARKLALDDCMSAAELAYRNRWNTSCRSLHQRDLDRLADCRDDWFKSDEACAQEIEVRPEIGCELVSDVAAAYAADLDAAQSLCRRQYQGTTMPAEPRPSPR